MGNNDGISISGETVAPNQPGKPLTVMVPLRLGPTKNLYQFTKLRDNYKQKFIQTSQEINAMVGGTFGLNRETMGPPPITGAFASLINSDLYEDFQPTNYLNHST